MKFLLLVSSLLVSMSGFCLTNAEVKDIVQDAYDGLKGAGEVEVSKVSAVKNFSSVFIGLGQVNDGLFQKNVDFEFKKVVLETDVEDLDYAGRATVRHVRVPCTVLVKVTKSGKKSVDVRECDEKAFKKAGTWNMSGYFEVSAFTDAFGEWVHEDINLRY